MENVKKCKNFLSTLIKLAGSQPAETIRNVKDLIQVNETFVWKAWGRGGHIQLPISCLTIDFAFLLLNV